MAQSSRAMMICWTFDSFLLRQDGKGLFAFQRLAAVAGGKKDIESVLAGFREDAFADFKIQRQQFIVFVKGRKNLT
jgi:hypothetical protein